MVLDFLPSRTYYTRKLWFQHWQSERLSDQSYSFVARFIRSGGILRPSPSLYLGLLFLSSSFLHHRPNRVLFLLFSIYPVPSIPLKVNPWTPILSTLMSLRKRPERNLPSPPVTLPSIQEMYPGNITAPILREGRADSTHTDYLMGTPTQSVTEVDLHHLYLQDHRQPASQVRTSGH